MLDNTVQAIELLPNDADQWHCPTLLDANAIDKFLEWLQSNTAYTERLVDQTWKISVLYSHVLMRHDTARTRRLLQAFHIQIARFDITRHRTFVSELQRAYFGNEADSAQSAELLAYGRQQSTDGRPVRIISRHRSFRLVPHIALYTMPAANEIGNDSNAAFLRTFAALDLHPKVAQAAFERFKNRDYPVAVSETAKTLISDIREIGRIHSLPFSSERNDQPMVDKALRLHEPNPRNSATRVVPHIKLNDVASPTDESEQRGYHDIMCGIVSALRNPNAHSPADEVFLRERFGDRRTALKFLCLLSLLFEKLDKRVGP